MKDGQLYRILAFWWGTHNLLKSVDVRNYEAVSSRVPVYRGLAVKKRARSGDARVGLKIKSLTLHSASFRTLQSCERNSVIF
jgi:hypothetical protein